MNGVMMGSHTPENVAIARLLFSHVRGGATRGCRILCASRRARCNEGWAARAHKKSGSPAVGSRVDSRDGERLRLGGGLDPRVVLEELLVQLDVVLPVRRCLVLGE